MFYLANVLELVVHGFDQCPFSQYYLVLEVHEAVFHVLAYFGYKVDAVNKKLLEQAIADISFVAEQFPKDLVMEVFVFQWIPIIYIGLRQKEIKYFAFVVDHQMKFETEEPSHGTLPLCGHALKDTVLFFPFDMA